MNFNYNNNPPFNPPQNQLYPQIYNPANAPPPVPTQPGQVHMSYPTQQYPYPGAFAYPTQMNPGQQGHAPPSSMSYPGINPTPVITPSAPPPSYGFQGVVSAMPHSTPVVAATVEWIPTTSREAHSLANRAIVAGYEGHDGSPLWVIRARFHADLVPGKLAIKHHAAYVPYGGNENAVQNIEVCCARPETVRWIESKDGAVPPNAVVGGNTSSGEQLYIGRAKEQGSLTPGKIHPSHKVLYMSFAGKEVPHKTYEVLCTV